MKFVLIQGLCLASYVGRLQTSVITLSDWNGDYAAFIEHYRVHGPKAL
jgi:hypothetical protein